MASSAFRAFGTGLWSWRLGGRCGWISVEFEANMVYVVSSDSRFLISLHSLPNSIGSHTQTCSMRLNQGKIYIVRLGSAISNALSPIVFDEVAYVSCDSQKIDTSTVCSMPCSFYTQHTHQAPGRPSILGCSGTCESQPRWVGNMVRFRRMKNRCEKWVIE